MKVLACLGAVAVVAWTAGVVLGRARAKQRHANVSPSELKNLQGRMFHARNMGMRLQELASNQQRLQAEQAHLRLLQDLKDEVQWLLSQVESTLAEHHKHDPDRLEDMLDATGKALRLVLDAGRQPMTTWQRAQGPWPTFTKRFASSGTSPLRPLQFQISKTLNHISIKLF